MITEKDLQDVVDSIFKGVIETISKQLYSPDAIVDDAYRNAVIDCASVINKLHQKTKDQLSKRLNGDA